MSKTSKTSPRTAPAKSSGKSSAGKVKRQVQQEVFPNLSYELLHTGIVCGVDEAGRGPLAGPVVAACVILNRDKIPDGINDSKKLLRPQREDLMKRIIEHHKWAIGVASVEEIDTINILQATKLAMLRAVEGLCTKPHVALIDGNQPPKLKCKTVSVIKGDTLSLSIAAASIIAKVSRDAMMVELSKIHPQYGFERHAGYSTKFHQDAIKQHGVCPAHRRSFWRVAETLDLFEAA